MQEPTYKAANLVEALPYIQRFYGKIVVIKYGGAAMTDTGPLKNVMQNIALLHFCGMRIVIVHGGGPEISQHCERLQLPVKFHQGLRITDEETMAVTQMVLLGKVNASLVKMLNTHRVQAVGLSGLDAGFLQARKAEPATQGAQAAVDLGFVGEVAQVDTTLIKTLLDKNFLPVIAPIGMDQNGVSYNINADFVAGAIAGALQAEKLVLLSDVNGLYADPTDPNTRISTITRSIVEELLQTNKITGGMIPKLRACLYALQQGIHCAHILDGRIQHSLLLEIFTDQGIGTMILQ